MGYRVKGTLKLPDGSPASNAEIEFISRKNFSPLVQELKSNILCGPTGAYDVTLEFGEYAVMVYPGGTYPAALGTIVLAADTVAGQDLPTLLQQAGWQPATPEYIQQIAAWLAEANASATSSASSAGAAKVSETNAKSSENAALSSKNSAASSASTATTKAAEAASSASAALASKNAAAASEANALASKNSAATSATTASAGASTATTKAGEASASATSAKVSQDAAKVSEVSAADSLSKIGSAIADAEVPYPDVWIPFNNDLHMEAGYGTNKVRIGEDTLTMPEVNNVDFTRASTATYIDKSGVLRTAAINEPRFEKEGLLIEGQSTNLITTSETANLTVSGGVTSVTTDTTTMPGFRLVKLVNDGSGTGNSPEAFGAQSFAVGDVLTLSAVFKMEEGVTGGRFRLRLAEGSTFWRDFSFYCDMRDENISGVTYTKTTPFADKSLVKVTATWTCDAAKTAISGQLQSLQVAGTCYVGCFQFEKLPFASSYIPTSGAAATRAADDCMILLDRNFNWKNANTVALEVNLPGYPSGNAGDIGITNDRRGIYQVRPSSSDRWVASMYLNNQYLTAYGLTTFRSNGTLGGGSFVAGHVFDGANVKQFSEGKAGPSYVCDTTDGAGTAGTLFRLGGGGGMSETHLASRVLNGHIRNFRIWHRALTDAQIKGLK